MKSFWMAVNNRGSSMQQRIALSLSFLALLWTICIFFLPRGVHQGTRFAVYFDAGSSGTRVHIFAYHSPSPHQKTYIDIMLPDVSKSVEPGLSHYASDPSQAGESLVPLLDFAYNHVPEDQWATTPVRLMATAGLRLVPELGRNSILDNCRSTLASSRFVFRQNWALVIPGEMEGLYAWTGANYASGALAAALENQLRRHSDSDSELTTQVSLAEPYHGVLELGGASFQVTFLHDSKAEIGWTPKDKSLKGPSNLKVPLPGVDSQLFTHSYLGLGMDAAVHSAASVVRKRWESREKEEGMSNSLFPDPCLPIGFNAEDGRYGASSFAGCLAIALEVLPTSGSKCRLMGKAALDRELEKSISLLASHHGSPLVSNETDSKAARGLIGPDHVQDDEEEISATGLDEAVRAANALSAPAASEKAEEDGDQCTVDGVKAPPLSGKFLAVENLYWTTKALGILHSDVTLQEIRDAGHKYCSHHWSSLHAEFSGHVPDIFLTRYCFGAAYVFALLHVGLGVGLDERRVIFTNTLKRKQKSSDGDEERTVGLSWVTGAAVIDAMSEEERRRGALSLFAGSSISGIILYLSVILIIACFIVWRLKWIDARRWLEAPTAARHDTARLKSKRSSSTSDLEATERGEYRIER